LGDIKTELGIKFVKNSIRASSNVQEKHEWVKNTNVFRGYEASYHYAFQIDKMDLISDIYDRLTSLAEATVAVPSFDLKNRDKVEKKALKHAWAKVTDRFNSECEVLGLNPSDFEVASWEVTYNDSSRSSRVAAHTRRVGAAMHSPQYDTESLELPIASAAGGAAPSRSEPLELVVGQAVVTSNLEVGYARRVSQTVKAQVVRPSNGLGNQEENHV